MGVITQFLVCLNIISLVILENAIICFRCVMTSDRGNVREIAPVFPLGFAHELVTPHITVYTYSIVLLGHRSRGGEKSIVV